MNNPYDEYREQAEFNNALGIITTIQECYTACNNARTKPYDIHMWNTALDNLFMTLSTSMKDTEKTTLLKTLDEIRDEVNKLSTVQNKLWQSKRQKIGVPMILFKKMIDFELQLRKIAKDAGLEMRVMDDAMKALR